MPSEYYYAPCAWNKQLATYPFFPDSLPPPPSACACAIRKKTGWFTRLLAILHTYVLKSAWRQLFHLQVRSKRSRHGMETVVSPALSRGLSREDLIKQYFFEGYEYCVIICFLNFVHGIRLSVGQLKMVPRCMNLRRRVHPSSHYHRTIRSLIQVSIILGPLCVCYCFCIGYHVRTYCVYYL